MLKRRRSEGTSDLTWASAASAAGLGAGIQVGFHELTCHVSDKDRVVVLSQSLNLIEKRMRSDAICFLVAGITYAADDTQKIQSYYSFLMVELIENAGE